MAFAKGKQSTDGVEIKRYKGVGTVKVLAVNPTKAEYDKIMGGDSKEIEYTSTTDDGTKTARVLLLVQPDKSKTIGGVEPILQLNFWFRKAAIQGATSGKYQIIDRYGETAWATTEEIANKQIPQYSNGPANIDKDYRKAINGEENFVKFLKAYLNIPNVRFMQNGQWVERQDKSECEARLENILKIFDGDFKEIKQVFNYQPDNKVQVMFGVRTTDDGKEYQDFLQQAFLTQNTWQRTRLTKELEAQKAIGRYASTDFGDNPTDDLHEVSLASSNITPSNTPIPSSPELPNDMEEDDDMPF